MTRKPNTKLKNDKHKWHQTIRDNTLSVGASVETGDAISSDDYSAISAHIANLDNPVSLQNQENLT